MLILKRLLVWLSERLVEVFLLGALFSVLLPNSESSIPLLWVSSVIVGFMLFVHGYYVTTAIVGLVWRDDREWLYAAIVAVLFIIHSHIVFLRGKPAFTPEARSMELPFLIGGAVLVFICSTAGRRILKSWLSSGATAGPYLSAACLTILLFSFVNLAHCLRPADYSNAFRAYGLPFTFYREGGFRDGWVWHGGSFVWRGAFADALIIVGVSLAGGYARQRLSRSAAH